MSEDLVLVGKIVKPHSIKGEVTVEIYCDDPNIFVKGKRVIALLSGGRRDFLILNVRSKKSRLILQLEGVYSRDEAENLRNVPLYVFRSELENTHEGEYYYCDLMGCDVFDVRGRFFGKVVAIFETNIYPILRIVDGMEREIELPFISKFIKDVFPCSKIVVDGEIVSQLLEINYPVK